MAQPDLTPKSQLSKIILPEKGVADSVDHEDHPLPFGIYTKELVDGSGWESYQIAIYKQGSADQVSYVYKKLGGDILDLEITEHQVYSAYEEACLEYSYLINIHQGKNVLSNILGASSGKFDSNGDLMNTVNPEDAGYVAGETTSYVQPGTNPSLRYPRFDFAYARRVADGISEEVGIGGSLTVHRASFTIERGKQDYNLQEIISSDEKYSNLIGTEKIQIKKVYYRTPRAMWHFYGMQGGTNVVGNFQSYGGYSNATYFHVTPVWDTKLTMQHFEDRLYNRFSHHSFELVNNNLRLYPIPTGTHPNKMWVEFLVGIDNWEKEPQLDGEPQEPNIGLEGINNLNTAPFPNIPYDRINSIGKQWIRRFALALCKEMLGTVRSKFGSIPIPGNDIQLNGADLVTQAKEEQAALRDELKEILDELTYAQLMEGDAKILADTSDVQKQIPLPIYVG